MNLEISENPSVLYDTSITASELRLLGRRLDESARLLKVDKVLDAAGKNPEGVVGCHYRDGRVFYMEGGVEVEYLLSARIEAVIKHGGWLTFPNRYGLRIWHEKIVEFAVHGGVLEFFQDLSKSDIVARFGEPELIDEALEYGDLMRTTFVYQQRKIRVCYDDWDHKVLMINLGASLIYGEHGKLTGPWSVMHK